MTLADTLARRAAPIPYSARSTNSLLFTAAQLKQADMALPTDLVAALNARGIEASAI